MSRLPDGATEIWVDAVRIAQIDSDGFLDPGAPVYTTDKVIKATATPVLETGDDIALKNAAGNLAVFGKHGDFARYYTFMMELGAPDALLEQMCAGGTLMSSSVAELATPTGLAVEANEEVGAGTIAKGIVGYRTSAYNAYGETVAEAEVTVELKAAGAAVIGKVVPPVGALGTRVYGRIAGQEQFIGQYKAAIGKPKMSGTIAAKAKPTSIKVEALPQALQAGTQFRVVGDTNKPKVVFTTIAYAAAGQTELQVEFIGAEVLLEIKPGELEPVFVDTGAIEPEGHAPTKNSTEGPGEGTGYIAPTLGAIPARAHAGVSIELFGEAILDGTQASDLPYFWWVFPRVKDMHVDPREFANAPNLLSLSGQAYENPNWGNGPTHQWPADLPNPSKVFQRTRCSRAVVPAPSLLNTPVS
jgi:hypothetical protein